MDNMWYNNYMFLAITLAAATLITNVTDLVTAICNRENGRAFQVTGIVHHVFDRETCGFILADDTGMTGIYNRCPTYQTDTILPGSVIRASGNIGPISPLAFTAIADKLALLGRRTPPDPDPASISDIKSGRFDFRHFQVTGTVVNVFRDEIDANYHYLIIADGRTHAYVTVFTGRDGASRNMASLINAEVAVTGSCRPFHTGNRNYLGRSIDVVSPNAITILRQFHKDPFDAPLADSLKLINPEDIVATGRSRLVGRVVAVWNEHFLLLKDSQCLVHTVELSDNRLPSVGDSIEAAGTLETDLYHLNLSNAIWRPTELPPIADEQPADITIGKLLYDETGAHVFHAEYHGRLVRLQGTVQDCSPHGVHPSSLTLSDNGFSIRINVEACPQILTRLAPLSKVSVTGICLAHTANWHSYAKFPHTTNISLIARTPEDIRLLSRPPWLTPPRMATVISALLLALIGFFAWNRILKRLITRRSRELFHEQVAHYGASLRIDERTRLAVELHDSLSQILTGVALEVETASQIADGANPDMLHHLNIASATLKSCRNELRNCLWDLRNQALDENSMNAAIQRTLLPHVKNVKTAIRFNIPRARLSDKTAHTILQIIRELVVNAINHGKATSITIAGSTDGNRLLFSVTNNGTPFDPDTCPGVAEGHFGLQGIRERLRRHAGTLSVSTVRERNVCVRVTMKIIKPQDPVGERIS